MLFPPSGCPDARAPQSRFCPPPWTICSTGPYSPLAQVPEEQAQTFPPPLSEGTGGRKHLRGEPLRADPQARKRSSSSLRRLTRRGQRAAQDGRDDAEQTQKNQDPPGNLVKSSPSSPSSQVLPKFPGHLPSVRDPFARGSRSFAHSSRFCPSNLWKSRRCRVVMRRVVCSVAPHTLHTHMDVIHHLQACNSLYARPCMLGAKFVDSCKKKFMST